MRKYLLLTTAFITLSVSAMDNHQVNTSTSQIKVGEHQYSPQQYLYEFCLARYDGPSDQKCLNVMSTMKAGDS